VICGVDANVLIYSAVESMPEHEPVLAFFKSRVLTGELKCAVTFPVLLEFVHITTDPRRFKPPLSVEESTGIAQQYWNAADWEQLLPKTTTGARAFDLLRRNKLGRKRLLDTYLAAALLDHGIPALITCNTADFRIFEGLKLIDPLQR
jgi:predicted nucleic acid-binding protein